MSIYTHPKNILVSTLQLLYDHGMTTTSGGNLSIKDDEGNIWITPSAIDKGSLRPDDIIKVTPDGKIIGAHKPSSELPFHRAVYSLRKDVRAVLHAHSPALVAFSLVGRVPDAAILPGCSEACGKVAFAKYEIPGSEELGKIIAAEFAKGADSVIMENHGAVMCGRTITQAFARFEALDYMARIQINACGLGETHDFSASQQYQKWETFLPDTVSPCECELRDEMANFRARCYKQGLLFSGNAFLSTKIENDDFLVTPSGFDPMTLDSNEMVRISGGRAEEGKRPSSAAALCREIYKKCPGVKAVIMTRPPYSMAFACTGTQLDSRTIPESYIMLRDIPLVKSSECFSDPEKVVKYISPSTPVIMLENCGMLATGRTLLEAFDRIEVGEFTAKCVIMANRIGKLCPIDQKQVDDLIKAFSLPE